MPYTIANYTSQSNVNPVTFNFGWDTASFNNNIWASGGTGGNIIYLYPVYAYPTTSTQPIQYQCQYQYQYNQWPSLWPSSGLGGYFNFNSESEEETKKRENKRKEASKRAEDLLLLHLDDKEKKQYLELGYFETIVNDKTYRINKGRAGNVYLVEKGKTIYRYCAHPREYSPEQDAMLAQLLMLRTDEERFLRTANRTVLA